MKQRITIEQFNEAEDLLLQDCEFVDESGRGIEPYILEYQSFRETGEDAWILSHKEAFATFDEAAGRANEIEDLQDDFSYSLSGIRHGDRFIKPTRRNGKNEWDEK